MTAADLEGRKPGAPAEIADHAGGEYDERKRRGEKEYRDERRRRDGQHHIVFQRAFSNALNCVQHDGQNRGLEAEEKTFDQRHVA